MNSEGEIKNYEAYLKSIMPFLETKNTISEIKTKWKAYIATYMKERNRELKSEKNYKLNSRGKDRKYMKNLKRN